MECGSFAVDDEHELDGISVHGTSFSRAKASVIPTVVILMKLRPPLGSKAEKHGIRKILIHSAAQRRGEPINVFVHMAPQFSSNLLRLCV